MATSNGDLDLLVWPCFSTVGIEIANQLRFTKNVNVIGASTKVDHPIKDLYKNVIQLPHVNTIESLNEYKPLLSNVVIFPAHDYVLDYITLNENLKYIGSPRETIENLRNKKTTYKLIEKSNLREYGPKIFSELGDVIFPVYAKPVNGYGSQDHYLIDNLNELTSKINEFDSYVFQEVLPGEEFTTECFSDIHGNLVYELSRTRKRIRMGTALSFDSPPDKTLATLTYLAEEISSIFKMRGPWNFQTKIDRNSKLRILEISPRIPGSAVWSRSHGYNVAEMAVYDYQEKSVNALDQEYRFEIERELASYVKLNYSYKHVYIDLDETLVVKGKLEPMMMAFIVKSRNEGKMIHLITKSLEKNLNSYLCKYHIENFFDTIIHLSENEKKEHHVHFLDSIFIDDSYQNRMNVKEALGIPVFSPDMIPLMVF